VARKKVSFRQRDVDAAPEGEAFVMLTQALLTSDAWVHRSDHLGRLIDFLLVEHLRHGRSQNGYLLAPFDQLLKFGKGISRKYIGPAVAEGERRGLLEARRQSRHPTRYRLTFLHSVKIIDEEKDVVEKHAPTNEWKRYREPVKSAFSSSRSGTRLAPNPELEQKSNPSNSAKSPGNGVPDRVPGSGSQLGTPS
jgi:hypothetical protein